MSTRANIVIRDRYNEELWFYRHSDGYPEITLPSLNRFLDLVKEGTIRDNSSQAAGWLILLGNHEYEVKFPPEDWKVGAYEPTSGQSGGIEFLYTIDLEKKTITCNEVTW